MKLIRTEEEYQRALKRMDVLFNTPEGSAESDEADVLALIIDAYEELHHPIGPPDPIEAIKIRMEEMQLRQSDLADDLGGKNRVSEVLNRKRKLSVDMIRKLSVRLQISVNILIADYQLTQ